MRRRNYRNLAVFGLGVFVAVFLFVFLAQRFGKIEDDTSAANLAGFNAGYIISDYQMTNYNSMSEADIQNFLWSKGRCFNTNFSGVGTRVDYFSDHTPPTTWHVSNGHTVCLAEENMNGESAAHIIWQAAQDYAINPKVLIVLIQKETGLITDPIPNSWDYQRTTGYGCPDTAACSEKYYGFKNQVRNAAYLFRIVMDGNSSYYPIGYNNVRYSPNPDCGSSTVYIKNLATSALYRYTPYQPNAGALAAGYGTAPCGAYGNRNFYAYFEDWFGGIKEEGFIIPKSSQVVEGQYLLLSGLDNGRVIDIDGGVAGAKNNTNIQIYNNNGTEAQRWEIKDNGDGSYTIVNPATDKVLDVQGGSKIKGANVQLYRSNGSCAQKWQIVENADKTYSIYSSCSGLALDVSGGVASNGANMNIWRANGSDAQKWKLYPIRTAKDGEYDISSEVLDDMVADISGGVSAAENGTNIQIFNFNHTEAQKWSVQYDTDDGFYTITNPATDKVLDVQGGSKIKGANVQLYRSNGSCAQKWQIVENADKTYSIYSSCSGLALDVSGGVASNGANMNIWRANGSDAQKWKLEDFDLAGKKELAGMTYSIVSAIDYNKTLDIAGGIDAADYGTNIQLWRNNGSAAQEWVFRQNDDGTYTFVNPDNKKVIDVEGASANGGANIQLWGDNGSCAQKWQINEEKNGYYVFKSACSDLVMDVGGGRAENGVNVNLWRANGSNAQRWRLKKR